MNQLLRLNSLNQRDTVNISHIGNNEYLIEASVEEARFIAETGEHDLSLVDIKDGPKISVGKDFLGQGYVDRISILRITPTLPLLLKVKLAK